MPTLQNKGLTIDTENVFINPENADIGDVICAKGTDGTASTDFRIMACGTATISGKDGYIPIGVIYGREREGFMVLALSTIRAQWAAVDGGASAGNFEPITTNTVGGGKNTMRNGKKHTYTCMNIKRVAALCETGTKSTDNLLHPTNAYYGSTSGAPMTKANFLANTNGAKDMYETYEAYIAQLKPILKGTAAGVFGVRCGRENTRALANATDGITYTAAQHCYTYTTIGTAATTWWLPDMYELALMYEDDTVTRCNKSLSKLGKSQISISASCWSSVRYSAAHAWYFDSAGMSGGAQFAASLWVRPVALLKL